MWKLALCQTDVVFKYPDANYARIEKAIVEAAKNGQISQFYQKCGIQVML